MSRNFEKESLLFRLRLRRNLLLSMLLLGSVNFVRAQSLSPYFGFGGVRDGVGTTNNTTALCPTGLLFDGVICEPGTAISGLFGVVGADFMFRTHLGINGEYLFRFSRAPFLPNAGLDFRPSFYDLNALYQPFSSKRIVPFLEGGIGLAKVSLYFNPQACVISTPCTDQSSALGSSNHFQLHGAGGVKVYIKGNIFVKPEFDLRWVRGLNQEFARSWVWGYTVGVGYTFGKR
jgi:hypothetical protein